MTRWAALFGALFLSTGCAAHSRLAPEPAAPPCDPVLRLPLEAEPEVKGGIIAPVTAEERAALAEFLAAEAEARAWGREGWRRLESARRRCPPD